MEFIASGSALGRQRSLAVRAKDPLVRLRALAAVAQSESVEAEFVAHAREFGEAEAIPVESWRQLGVKDDVLRKAGILTGSKPARASKARSSSRAAAGSRKRQRASALDLDAVAAKLPRKPFTVKDLAARLERPADTSRKYLDQLVAAERVTVVGETSGGRGKPAKIYQRA